MMRTRTAGATAIAAALALALGACGKEEDSGAGSSAKSGGGTDSAQQVKQQGEGQCTVKEYGAKKVDLANATVGFSQSEKEANPFRIAETQSIKDEAKKVGVKKLLTTNANSQLAKQISDIQDMLAQGAQALIVAPLNSEGLEPAFEAAKKKGVPVVTTDRTKGFMDQIKAKAPGIKVVAQQTGEFARDKGQQVTEQLLQSNPDIDAIYAENDEMALGAIVAVRGAGKKPGQDVKVVSIDGTANAVRAIVDGKINAVIESNPRFGPLAFKTLTDFMGGKGIPDQVIIS